MSSEASKQPLSVDELVAEASKLIAEQEKERVELGDFDPFATTEAAKQVQQIYDEKLGWIKFGDLNFKDNQELVKIDVSTPQGKQERLIKYVYLSLKKGYPELTLVQVQEWPDIKLARLGLALSHRTERFLAKKTLPTIP